MATYDEIFSGYTPENQSRQAKSYYDKVFAGYEPPQKETTIGDKIENAVKLALSHSPFAFFDTLLPDGFAGFATGSAAETAGNFLQRMGDPDKTLAARYDPAVAEILRTAGGTAQDIADSAIEYGASHVKPRNNDEYLGALGNAYDSGFLGVMSGNASMFHSDKSASAMSKAVQDLADQTPVDPEFSLDYILSPHGLTRSFGQMAGSMGAIMPTMALMPESAALRLAGGLGGNAITSFLVNRGLYGAAKQVANRLPDMVRYAATSPWIEGISEGGHFRTDNLAKGMSEEEATQGSINTALANVPLLMASNFLEAGLLGMPFLKTTTSPFKRALQIQIWQVGNFSARTYFRRRANNQPTR